MTVSSALVWAGGAVLQTAGTLNVQDTFIVNGSGTWSGVSSTVLVARSLVKSDSGVASVNGGALRVLGGNLTLSDGTLFTNQTAVTLMINSSIIMTSTATITHRGTSAMNIYAAVGTSVAGTLDFGANVNVWQPLTTAASAKLLLSSGTCAFSFSGATFTLLAAITVSGGNLVLQAPLNLGGPLQLRGGSVQASGSPVTSLSSVLISGGSMVLNSDWTHSGATFNITNGSTSTITGTSGTLTFSGATAQLVLSATTTVGILVPIYLTATTAPAGIQASLSCPTAR